MYSDRSYRCEGTVESGGKVIYDPATIGITVTEYGFLWRLLGETQGMVVVEAPKHGIPMRHFYGLERVGNSTWHIHRDDLTDLPDGQYYPVTGHLILDVFERRIFAGDCVPVS
jgi:hypothetical protein